MWEREQTFAALRAQNADGPIFSFVDGPVTANRMVLGVHTAWGRTLKDVFQRYKALHGFHQRYQNGFDCQGLWIEVGVERSLGLNSKREIEEFGLAEFARRCREVVVRSRRGADRGLDPPRAMDGLGAATTSPSPTRTSSTSGASCRSSTSGVGCTSATAPPSGARGAARRSRRTSCTGRTRNASTRRFASGSRCATVRARRSSCGRRRLGRFPRTSLPLSTRRRSTGASRPATGSPSRSIPTRRSSSAAAARSWSAGATRAHSTRSARVARSSTS